MNHQNNFQKTAQNWVNLLCVRCWEKVCIHKVLKNNSKILNIAVFNILTKQYGGTEFDGSDRMQ